MLIASYLVIAELLLLYIILLLTLQFTRDFIARLLVKAYHQPCFLRSLVPPGLLSDLFVSMKNFAGHLNNE